MKTVDAATWIKAHAWQPRCGPVGTRERTVYTAERVRPTKRMRRAMQRAKAKLRPRLTHVQLAQRADTREDWVRKIVGESKHAWTVPRDHLAEVVGRGE